MRIFKKVKLLLAIGVLAVVVNSCEDADVQNKVQDGLSQAKNLVEEAKENLPTLGNETDSETVIEETTESETKEILVSDGSTLTVRFLDVGQGDSILAECDGHYMLIDAGQNDQGSVVVNDLKELGVEKLDYVIGTHPDSDHIGGLDDVINTFEVEKVMLPDKTHTTKTYESLLQAISDNDLKITVPEVGDTYSLGSSSFVILCPMTDYGDDNNNWSIGIKLTLGDIDFVMCGDAEEESELDMTLGDISLDAEVLKLGHHGSHTSTCEEFLDAVSPDYAIISCGVDNSYGHPHTETLEKLEARNITTYRTDLQGTITAVTNGKDLEWTTEK